MIRPAALGLAAVLSFATVATVTTVATVAVAQTPAYSVKSNVGDLLDNADAKAVLNKYIADVISNPMIDMARGFPLEGLAMFIPTLTPELLAKIDADLAKVVKK